MNPSIHHIIISRTDNLGDVMLTLPLAGYLKQYYPQLKISFLGKAYTRPLIDACQHVDEFIDREEVLAGKSVTADAILFIYPDKEIARWAKREGIAYRVGTSHRIAHWWLCNKLVAFSRKKSDLHESQLNFKLLKGLSIDYNPSLDEIAGWYGFNKIVTEKQFFADSSSPKIRLIFHPKSKGSAREWPLAHYKALAELLGSEHFEIYITGTSAEGEQIRSALPSLFDLPHVHDCTGLYTLTELISFIHQADGLVACSTGPLHIASALGKVAIGIYPPLVPMHPGRWAPIGIKAKVFVKNTSCNACNPQQCACIASIGAADVAQYILESFSISKSN